jgi:hypothetical protein
MRKGVQEFRSSGVHEFRSSGVQEFSLGLTTNLKLKVAYDCSMGRT